MNDKRLALLATGIVAGILVVVLPVFAWPYSTYATTVERFQTFIGGALAALAAAATAVVVYRAATLPIVAERERKRKERIADELIGGAILFAELNELRMQLSNVGNVVQKKRGLRRFELAAVAIPPHLRNFDLISTQPPDIAGKINMATLRVSLVETMLKIIFASELHILNLEDTELADRWEEFPKKVAKRCKEAEAALQEATRAITDRKRELKKTAPEIVTSTDGSA